MPTGTGLASYQAVFKRYEKKYMLTREQYSRLLPELETFMRRDEYGVYTICSLYFDTADFAIIRQSLSRPRYKEKMRLRSYGPPQPDGPVYAELKKKADGVVFKRRVALPYGEVIRTLGAGILPEAEHAGDHQILNEIDWFMRRWQPRPRVLISYDRLALAGVEDPSLRITFDFSVRWRDRELDMTAGDHGAALFTPGQHCLMEVKTAGAIPCHLSRRLSELSIFPCSFSKYGTVYASGLLPHTGGGQALSSIKGGFSHAG